MKIGNLKINIYDINIILTFVGFSVFTTFVDSNIGSILYRAGALFIAIICLYLSGFKYIDNKLLKIFITIYCIFLLKVTIYAILVYDIPQYTASKNNALLWGYGICLIPMLAVTFSCNRLHFDSITMIVFLALFIVLGSSLLSPVEPAMNGRVALNARQSTLTYGDNGAFLSLLSMAYLSKFKSTGYRKVWIVLFITGLIVGILSIAKAGSRGPFVGALVGLIVIISFSGKYIKLIGSIFLAVIIMASVAVLSYIKDIAPILYSRMMGTIENQDMSGRDTLFQEALYIITSNPILGGNPIIWETDGNFTSHHNLYLTVGVGLGVIGLMVFAYLLCKLLKGSFKYKHRYDSPWDLFIVGMFFFFIIRSLSGVIPISNPSYCVVMVLLCSLINYYKTAKIKISHFSKIKHV